MAQNLLNKLIGKCARREIKFLRIVGKLLTFMFILNNRKALYISLAPLQTVPSWKMLSFFAASMLQLPVLSWDSQGFITPEELLLATKPHRTRSLGMSLGPPPPKRRWWWRDCSHALHCHERLEGRIPFLGRCEHAHWLQT